MLNAVPAALPAVAPAVAAAAGAAGNQGVVGPEAGAAAAPPKLVESEADPEAPEAQAGCGMKLEVGAVCCPQ